MLLLPGRFSTTIGWPRLDSICLPTSRARMSAAEPGPNPIKTLIGCVGYVCATTEPAPATDVTMTPAKSAAIFRVWLNIFPPSQHFIPHLAVLTLADTGPTASACREVFASIDKK